MDEILINKKTSIDRRIKRILEDYQEDFITNFTKQDAIILNIERACQAAIDIGNRIIRLNRLGVPKSNRETFEILGKNQIITPELSVKMQAMAGFRNLAVHGYSSMDQDVVIDIIENRLKDLQIYAEQMLDLK